MLGVAAVETLSRFKNVRAGRDIPLPFKANVDTGPLGRAIQAIDAQLREARNTLKGAQSEIERVGRTDLRGTLRGAVVDLDRSVNNVFDRVLTFRNVLLGLGVGQLARSVFEVAQVFEQAELALTSVLGSQTLALEALTAIEGIAERLGGDTAIFASEFAKFRASTTGTDLAPVALEMFENIASALSQLGVGADRQRLVFNAFTQIVSKGKLTTEELRRQLSESLVGAMQAAATSVGTDVEGLERMLADGELIAEDVLPDFTRVLAEQLGPEVGEAITGTLQSMTRFENDVRNVKLAIARGGLVESFRSVLVDEFRPIMIDPEFQGWLAEGGSLAGDVLVGLASSVDEIFLALSSIVALKLAAGIVKAANLVRLIFTGAAFLNPWSLVATLLLSVGQAVLAVTDTTIIDVAVSIKDSVFVLIDALSEMAAQVPGLFEAIPRLVSETAVSLFEAIAGLIEDFVNSLIEGFNFFGDVVGITIDPLNLDFDTAREQLAQAGQGAGERASAEFERRWSLNPIDAIIAEAEAEIIPDLITISTGLDRSLVTLDEMATAAAVPGVIIDEIDTTLGSSFATFTAETGATFEDVLGAGDITFDRVRRSSSTTYGDPGSLIAGILDPPRQFFENIALVIQEQFADLVGVVAEAAGIEQESLEAAFTLGVTIFEVFADDLEEVVGETATEAVVAFGDLLQGDLTGLTDFLFGAWGQHLDFLNNLTGGLGGIFAGSNVAHQTNSTQAANSAATAWGQGKELFDTVSGFVGGVHRGVNTAHSADSSSLVNTASVESQRFADSFASETNANNQSFGSFVGQASSQFAGFVQSSVAAGQEIANVGAAAIGGLTGQLSSVAGPGGLTQILSLLSTPSGGAGGLPNVPDFTPSDVFGPITAAQAAGQSLAERFFNVAIEGPASTTVGFIALSLTGNPLIAAGAAGLARIGVDFITDQLAAQLGVGVGSFLDSVTGGLASRALGGIQRGLQTISDVTGFTALSNAVGDARDFVTGSISNLARSAFDTVRDVTGFGGGGGGSFSDSSSFGGRDRTSQPSGSGGIGSFALGGVISGLAGQPRAVEDDDGFVLLELARSPSGRLSVIAPKKLETAEVKTRVIVDFTGAPGAAVQRFAAGVAERGWSFEEDPVIVRDITNRLELEVA